MREGLRPGAGRCRPGERLSPAGRFGAVWDGLRPGAVRRGVRGAAPSHTAGPPGAQVVRCTLELEAWARGRTTSRSTLTCEGRVIAQVMVSATSSALSGWSTPA